MGRAREKGRAKLIKKIDDVFQYSVLLDFVIRG